MANDEIAKLIQERDELAQTLWEYMDEQAPASHETETGRKATELLYAVGGFGS